MNKKVISRTFMTKGALANEVNNVSRRQRGVSYFTESMFKASLNKCFKQNSYLPILTMVRHVRLKVYPSRSLKERLQAMNPGDPEIDFKVDIGFPQPPPPSRKVMSERLKLSRRKKNDLELEHKSRTLTLEIDTESVREEWLKADGPKHIQTVAEHYGIFDDLFGDAYFTPYLIMNVHYPQKDSDLIAPVCWGNVVKPKEALLVPVVKYESKPEDLWTLTLVSPDGHLTEQNMEYVHWFVGNIPGDDVSKGEIIWDYLPPFPPRGIGFQRLVFILYKQEKKMDYSSLKKEIPCLELKDRSFKTLEFYRERQDELTPASLAFFQSDWDRTVKKTFHEVLNMEEPVFEYDFPPKVFKKQSWFPKKEPFNMYLDRYRDPKDINAEYLTRQLKELNPFEAPKPPFPYPKAIAMNFKNMPSWLAKKEAYYRLRKGRVTQLETDEYD